MTADPDAIIWPYAPLCVILVDGIRRFEPTAFSGAPSCTDLIRASNNAAGRLDTRVKPAYDVHCEAEPLAFGFHL
jgi:hypothetical protein